jgi:hypothetical protein
MVGLLILSIRIWIGTGSTQAPFETTLEQKVRKREGGKAGNRPDKAIPRCILFYQCDRQCRPSVRTVLWLEEREMRVLMQNKIKDCRYVFELALVVVPLDGAVAGDAECRWTAGRLGPARQWGWPTFGGDGGANYGQPPLNPSHPGILRRVMVTPDKK